MATKLIIAVETIVIIAALVLLTSGNLVWNRGKLGNHQSLFENVKDSAEILKPHTLKIDGEEMLVVPQFSIKGSSSWNFDYSIYTYDKDTNQLIVILK